MPVEKYLEAENVSEFNKEIVKSAILSPGLEITEIDGYADPERYEFFMPSQQRLPRKQRSLSSITSPAQPL